MAFTGLNKPFGPASRFALLALAGFSVEFGVAHQYQGSQQQKLVFTLMGCTLYKEEVYSKVNSIKGLLNWIIFFFLQINR